MRRTFYCACLLLLFASTTVSAQEDLVLSHKLDNGLEMLVLARTDVPLAYCRIAYQTGSSKDPKGLEGMAEFLRRLTFHGTHVLGTMDVSKERLLRDRIEKTRQSRDSQLARFPRKIFEKLKDLPRRIRAVDDRLRARLRLLSAETLPPMSRKDMEEILIMVRDEEARMDAMRDEIAKIQSGPHYQGFKSVQVLDNQLVKDQEQLTALLVPDPIRSTYCSSGALRIGSSTGKDSVLFSAELPANRVELFFWVESQRMRDSVFRNFDAEKDLALKVAAEKMNSSPLDALSDRATFPDHPYGNPVFGNRKSVGSFEIENVQEHYRRTYTPDEAVIVVVGNVDPDRVFYLGERYFGSMKKPEREAVKPQPPSLGGPCLLVRFQGRPSVEHRYILPGFSHPDWAACEWFTSYLRETFRSEKPPLASDVLSACELELRPGRLIGLLTLRAIPAPSVHTDHLSGLLKKTLQSILVAPPDSEKFEAARRKWKISASARVEDPSGTADLLAMGAVMGSWKKVFPSALDGLEPVGAYKRAAAYLSGVEPVEIISEGTR